MGEADACIGSGSPGNSSNVMVVSTNNSSIVLVAADAAATKKDGAKAMEPQSQTRGQVQMIMHERRMLLWNQSMKDDQLAASQSDDKACCGKSLSKFIHSLAIHDFNDKTNRATLAAGDVRQDVVKCAWTYRQDTTGTQSHGNCAAEPHFLNVDEIRKCNIDRGNVTQALAEPGLNSTGRPKGTSCHNIELKAIRHSAQTACSLRQLAPTYM